MAQKDSHKHSDIHKRCGGGGHVQPIHSHSVDDAKSTGSPNSCQRTRFHFVYTYGLRNSKENEKRSWHIYLLTTIKSSPANVNVKVLLAVSGWLYSYIRWYTIIINKYKEKTKWEKEMWINNDTIDNKRVRVRQVTFKVILVYIQYVRIFIDHI